MSTERDEKIRAARERIAQDATILRLAAEGIGPSGISRELGITVDDVNASLEFLGLTDLHGAVQ